MGIRSPTPPATDRRGCVRETESCGAWCITKCPKTVEYSLTDCGRRSGRHWTLLKWVDRREITERDR